MSNFYVFFLSLLLCLPFEANCAQVLFVGCLDAEAEMDFKQNILHLNSDKDEIVFTSYGGPEEKLSTFIKTASNPGYTYVSKVNATTLDTDTRFKKAYYDYIVWIGPRADPGDAKDTGTLVMEFFKAAMGVVKRDSGVICMAQNLDSPHFADLRKKFKTVNSRMLKQRRISIKNRKKSDGTALSGNREDHLHCINYKREDVTLRIMQGPTGPAPE